MLLMFLLKNSFINIKKNKVRSCICLLVVGMLLLLLSIYIQNIASVQQQLQELGTALPVSGNITTLNGDSKTGLMIKEDLYQSITTAKSIEQLKTHLLLRGGIGEFDLEEYQQHLRYSVMAVNDVSSFREDMTENTSFAHTDEAICIVNEDVMAQNGWAIGDVIPLNLYLYYFDTDDIMQLKPLAVSEYKIIDSMEETTSDLMEMTDILVSLENVRTLYHQEGQPFAVNFLSFYVKEPLKLNVFKEEMKSFGLLSVRPAADFDPQYSGVALSVKDSAFIATATQLRQQEALLQSFFPMVFVIVILVGYITSTLLIQSRQKDFRLMRIIGISKMNAIVTFFYEQLFLVVIGLLIGIVILWATRLATAMTLLIASAICFGYCFGVLVSLLGLARKNIMENKI